MASKTFDSDIVIKAAPIGADVGLLADSEDLVAGKKRTKVFLLSELSNTHTHTVSQITDFDVEVSTNTTVVGNNAHLTTTNNPHSVTPAQVGNDTAQWNANKIQGKDAHTVTPTDGQVLKFVNAADRYEATTLNHSDLSDFDTELAGKTNTTAFTPTADYHPATKKYVDDQIGQDRNSYVSAENSISSTFDVTHSLGVVPKYIYVRCVHNITVTGAESEGFYRHSDTTQKYVWMSGANTGTSTSNVAKGQGLEFSITAIDSSKITMTRSGSTSNTDDIFFAFRFIA